MEKAAVSPDDLLKKRMGQRDRYEKRGAPTNIIINSLFIDPEACTFITTAP